MSVHLTLKCKRTGRLFYQESNPLQEAFRKNPLREIEDWIQERGNAKCNTRLELVSYYTTK